MLAVPLARAQADNVYQGKSLTMVIGFAPGGGVDTAARLMGKHLWRFVPGATGMVFQNMESAAGLLAANYLDKRASTDGLVIGVPGRSWFVEAAIKNPSVQFDATRFHIIGSGGMMNSLAWVRHDAGIRSMADLKAAKEKLVFGALGSGTPTAMVPNLLAASGYPIRVIAGYVSTARTVLAIEQGEIPALYVNEDGLARRHDLIDKKIILPIAQSKPVLPDLPLFRNLVSDELRPVLELAMAPEMFGLMIVAPPGVPPQRTEILRSAFRAMLKDPEYIADASRGESVRGDAIEGDELHRMMKELMVSTKPDIAARYHKIKSNR